MHFTHAIILTKETFPLVLLDKTHYSIWLTQTQYNDNQQTKIT